MWILQYQRDKAGKERFTESTYMYVAFNDSVVDEPKTDLYVTWGVWPG